MACNLYSLLVPAFSTYQYNILDCSGNTQTLVYPAGVDGLFTRFCANEILEFTGDTPSVASGACQSNCTCFTLNGISTVKTGFNYINCNNDFVVPVNSYSYQQPGQFFDFCALFVTANTESYIITNNGDCTTGCTFCRCITVHNVALDNYSFNYTDCNGVTGTTNLVSGQTITFCGLDTSIVVGVETTGIAINYGNECVADPGGDYPFKCPCKCTTVSDSQNAVIFNTNLIYVDCGGNTNTILPTYSGGRPTVSRVCMQNSVSVIPGVRAQPYTWTTLYGNDCIDNSCPCYCYSIDTRSQPFSLEYQECGSISATTHNIPIGVTTFCSTSIITQQEIGQRGVLFTGNTCSSGSCVCTCYSLTRTSELTKEASYIDCNGYIQTVNLENGTQKVCGIGLIYRNVENIDVTNEGPCIDGNCPSAPITGDCICYSIINESGEFTFPYLDCDGIQTNIVIPIGTTSFCSTSTITQADITSLSPRSVLFTGGICSSGDSYSCVCTCYSLTNTTESLGKQSYIDCFSQPQKATIPIGETVKICSIGFDIIQSGLDVVSEGPCIDGNCPSAPITGDCTCYYVISTNGLETIDVEIVDCDRNLPTVLALAEGESFCAKSYISASEVGSLIGRSDGLCIDGLCPNNVNCYNIDAGEGSDVQTYYIDPEGFVSLISKPGPINFCAIAVLTEYDGKGNPVGNELGTVTNTGDCIFNETEGLYNCPAPCYCFYSFDSTFVDYINCNYETVTLSLNPGFNKICAQSVISSDGTFYDSGLLCDNNRCPNYCCNCYTILTEGDGSITYLNCDLQLSEVNVSSGEPVQICALNVPPGDRYSVTLNGPCYNGQCVDTMSIQDQLLYDILTTYGPCPDICCGENEAFGGPMGIDVTDIKSGKVL